MRGLLTKDTSFFDNFDRAADNMLRCAELLHEMVTDFERRVSISGAIRDAERRGDDITHDTIHRLDRTYITPLDREDILKLINSIDDVVDGAEAAAQRMLIYKVEKPTDDFVKQTEIAVETCRVLVKAVKMIRTAKKPKEMEPLLIEVHDLENRADDHNHAALGRLFENDPDPLKVIKWKELYELLEDAVDSANEVANTLRSVMVKNA